MTSPLPADTAASRLVVPPYRHEKALFTLLAVIAILFWVAITVGTFGIVWLYMVFFYLFALFAQSALISHLKGNAVRIDATQFPDLHERIAGCAARLGITPVPEAFLMSGDGMLNAFATRFLRRYYVVLLSDVVDALDDDPEAINFYIGHELGHIDRQHIANGWWMAPAMLLPLAGAAYRRAQEYTCDQYGLACCAEPASAARALAVLAAGPRRWKQLSAEAYVAQCAQSGGFWMSLNELASDYPWLSKRMARIQNPAATMPGRHPFAWVLAFFMPRLGPGGPLVGIIMFFALIGILAAIAIPAYQDYMTRATAVPAFQYGTQITQAVGKHLVDENEVPETLDGLGVPSPAGDVQASIDANSAVITLVLPKGATISYTPSWDADEQIVWECETTLSARALPKGVECSSLSGGAAAFGGLGALR